MYYSDELITEIIEKNDIVDVISSCVKLSRKGSNYFGLCPFHDEKTGSFSVSSAKKMFYCFGCHEGGNVIRFIQKYEKMSFPEAVEFLAKRAGIILPDSNDEALREENKRKEVLLEIYRETGTYYSNLLRSEAGRPGMEYFRNRGLNDTLISQFGLGFAQTSKDDLYTYLTQKGYDDKTLCESGLLHYRENLHPTDRFWARVIFPIMDARQTIIGFGGRAIDESKPKYLNSPETPIFDKSRTLYGLHIAKASKAKNIIICEGYMDVLSLHQAGFDQAVATLGTAFTVSHAKIIEKYARIDTDRDKITRHKDIILCFDTDKAGADAVRRAQRVMFEEGLRPKVIDLTPHKDPDEFIKELGAEEFQLRIDDAENGFLYEIRMLEDEYDMLDPSGKSDFITNVAARLLRFDNPVERDIYADVVADKYGVSMEAIRSLFEKKSEETT